MKAKQQFSPFFLFLALLVAGCSGKQTLRGVFKNQTPYEQYAAKLKDAKLDETALGQDWLQAGTQALQDSITVSLPFRETGYFAADVPKALGYRFDARRGERIVVNLEMKAREQLQVFIDLFTAPLTQSDQPAHLAAADSSHTLAYEVEEDQPHILRLQPELLRSGQYTLTIQTEPTLAFPVEGKSSRHITSSWGAARDGGRRSHEGIDIFARRGTPVLAATAGLVSRVHTTPRGGKVIWLTDLNRRQSLYYAHLDSQLVTEGQRVQPGDTIGLVGNTGNAIGTGPHLHFGIYRFGRGPTDPHPYVYRPRATLPAIKVDVAKLGTWVRVTPKAANVRLQPSTKSPVYRRLPRHTPLHITGGTSAWYRVALPSGREAYIAASLVEAASRPVKYEQLAADAALLEAAHPLAPAKEHLRAGSSVAVLGSYNSFRFVRNVAGQTGWIQTKPTLSAR